MEWASAFPSRPFSFLFRFRRLLAEVCDRKKDLLWYNITYRQEVFPMAKIPTMIPVSDLRQDAARVLRDVNESAEPLFITQRGRATAVLMSLDAYQRAESERELLSTLARGEKEIAAGGGHKLAEVLAEAEALLAED